MRNTDRILVLEKADPKNKDIGLMDPKAFTGENKLHGVMDLVTGLWSFKYERGIVPPQLKNKFTSFNVMKQHAEEYFKTRNIKIAKVID